MSWRQTYIRTYPLILFQLLLPSAQFLCRSKLVSAVSGSFFNEHSVSKKFSIKQLNLFNVIL